TPGPTPSTPPTRHPDREPPTSRRKRPDQTTRGKAGRTSGYPTPPIAPPPPTPETTTQKSDRWLQAKALNHLHKMRSAEWEIMWAVVGAAIAIMSIPLDGPLGLAAAVAAGAAGVLSAGLGEPEDPPKTPFSASSSVQVTDLTLQAVRKLTQDIGAAEAE